MRWLDKLFSRRAMCGASAMFLCVVAGCFGADHLPKPRPSLEEDEPAPPPQTPSAAGQAAPDAAEQPTSGPTAGEARPGQTPAGARSGGPAPALTAEELAAQPLPIKPKTPLTVEARRARSTQNLYKIAHALNQYVRDHKRFPAPIYDRAGRPLLSWRVRLLPALGYESLAEQFRFQESWDSPHNRRLLELIPPPYQSPERFDARTNYLAPVGPDTALAMDAQAEPPYAAEDFEQTILVVEVDESRAVPWTKPEEYPFDPLTPRAGLETLRDDGFFAVLGKGRVHVVPRNLDDAAVASFFTLTNETQQVGTVQATRPLEESLAPAQVQPLAPLTAHSLSGASSRAAPASGDAGPGSSAESPSAAAPRAASGGSGVRPDSASEGPSAHDALGKLPVPDALAQKAAQEHLRELFQARYEEAKRSHERLQIAHEILGYAARLGDDAAAQYVMLRAALDIAAAHGDLKTARKACGQLIAGFKVDPIGLQLHAVKTLGGSAGNDEKLRRELAAWANEIYEEAYARDDFSAARESHQVALSMARTAGDRALVRKVIARSNEVETARREYARTAKAIETLEQFPDDPTANRIVGEYFCLVKGEWDRGLPFLLKGDDRPLAELAAQDLALPADPEVQAALADRWWRLAEEHRNPQKEKLQARAVYWYRQAAANLPEGLAKVKAEIRLKEWDKR